MVLTVILDWAEIQSENFHSYESMGCGGGAIVTVAVLAAQDHGLESPDFIRMTPTPIPWTYMDSFVDRIDMTVRWVSACCCTERPVCGIIQGQIGVNEEPNEGRPL